MTAVRSRLIVDVKPLNAMKQGIDNIPSLVFDVAEEAVQKSEALTLTNAGIYPPPRTTQKFRFTTAKSRRWYFANKVNKKGIFRRYQRTYQFKQSWQIFRFHTDDTFVAEFGSTFPAAQYIVGNLARKHQVPGHMDTGWRFFAPVAEQWQLRLISDFNTIYRQRLGSTFEIGIPR